MRVKSLCAAAEGNVKSNDGFCRIVHVHSLIELRAKQRLLGRNHFKIDGFAVIHQFMRALIGIVKHLHLSMIVTIFFACRLSVGKSLVHLVARVDYGLHILIAHSFLREFGNFKIAFDLSAS